MASSHHFTPHRQVSARLAPLCEALLSSSPLAGQKHPSLLCCLDLHVENIKIILPWTWILNHRQQSSSYFSGVVFCGALVPCTLALDLPTLILQRFLVFLCLTVITEFVSLLDEESGSTLGILLMSLGRKNGLMWRKQLQQWMRSQRRSQFEHYHRRRADQAPQITASFTRDRRRAHWHI